MPLQVTGSVRLVRNGPAVFSLLSLFGVKHQQDAKHYEKQWPDFFEEFAPGPLNFGEAFGQSDSTAGERKTSMFPLNVVH